MIEVEFHTDMLLKVYFIFLPSCTVFVVSMDIVIFLFMHHYFWELEYIFYHMWVDMISGLYVMSLCYRLVVYYFGC